MDVRPLFSNSYLRALYSRRFAGVDAVIGYWKRMAALAGARKYDLIWIEKEIFPFFPAFAEQLLARLKVPYVADYDDALFHRYDMHGNWLVRSLLGSKIDIVMKRAALVMTGNEYLANRARTAGACRVTIVPTVVDVSRYRVADEIQDEPLVVGWIGSPSTTRYLAEIGPVISGIVAELGVRFRAVGASDQELESLPIDVAQWTEETEVDSIQSFSIGIMPLAESPWERGKCGYKIIQYMACGLPVVASPVGVNKQIIQHGLNGYLARDEQEWTQSLRRLIGDANLRQNMGRAGRALVERKYSTQVQGPRIESIMRSVLNTVGGKNR